MAYTEAQLQSAVILPMSGTINIESTGAGGGHGATTIAPIEGGPVWAPGHPGWVNVGAYFSDTAAFYGSGYGEPDVDPTLPSIGPGMDSLVHMIAMVKVGIPHFSERKEEGAVDWHSGGLVTDWPRVSASRPGTGKSARSSGAGTFEWNGWKMIPIDTGDLVTVYQGYRTSFFNSNLKIRGAIRGFTIGGAREAATWTIDEVALMIVPYTLTKVAPPCRLIRDDDLGVGASRLYPPPRSQQRSIRGVGYY